jgi:hypothetical protein
VRPTLFPVAAATASTAATDSRKYFECFANFSVISYLFLNFLSVDTTLFMARFTCLQHYHQSSPWKLLLCPSL